MRAVRFLQIAFIFFGFVVVGLSLAAFGDDETSRRAALALLGEGFAAGLAACIVTLFVLSKRGGENFIARLSGLMFVTLAVFAVAWTAFTAAAGLHHAEGIGLVGRAVRSGFGYLFGWFSLILVLFARQTFFPPAHLKSEEDSPSDR